MVNILGLEVTRAQKMAAPTTAPRVQNTLPSVPLSRADPKTEIGDSGTKILSGFIHEEYNGSLSGIAGIRVYEEMRKSDATVRAAMLVTTLPIRRAIFIVKKGTDDKQGDMIREFVEKNLFEWLDLTWDDVLRQALLMVPFGVMPFEKVYGVRDWNGKKYVYLEKLAPRLPKSIQSWELSNKTFGIQQIRQDGKIAEIPGSKLVIFVNEREGDNWWGVSMLRAAYKHWYLKDTFYKIDAIAFERQGIGIPKITMPINYTVTDEAKAKQAMQNLRANENAYLLLPNGYEAEFMNMGSSTVRDPKESIAHHDRQITKAVLAQFLELGSTSVGSKSLSEDHTELFLKSLEAIADNFVDEMNELIKEIVDLNFDNVETYPKLDYSGISKVDVERMASAYGSLVTAGGITPTDNDQQYLRATMGLPEITEEELEEKEEDVETEPASAKKDTEDIEEEEPVDDKNVEVKPKKASDHIHGEGCGHDSKLPQTYSTEDGFSSWRPLTFAEKKVSWKKIEDKMNELEREFNVEAKAVIGPKKDAFIAKLRVAMEAGDTKAVQALEVKFTNEYKSLLKDYMKKAYEYGKNNVSTEIGVSVPANKAETLGMIDIMADTAASKLASDLEAKAKLAAANSINKQSSRIQDIAAIETSINLLVEKGVDAQSAVMIGQNINMGRNDVFQRNIGMVHNLQRSEILDKSTCNFCESIDGYTILPSDEWARADTFHSSCRGLWVATLTDEAGVEDTVITGIPDELADLYGWQPNSLVQPKTVINKGKKEEK